MHAVGAGVAQRLATAAEALAMTSAAFGARVEHTFHEPMWRERVHPVGFVDEMAPAEVSAATGLTEGLAGRKVRVSVPQRGNKRGLLDLAHRNAELSYRARFDSEGTEEYQALGFRAGVAHIRAIEYLCHGYVQEFRPGLSRQQE